MIITARICHLEAVVVNVIKSINYPGSIENFRALMNRFVLLRQWRWRTESSQYAIYLENIPKDNPTPASSQSTWCVDELVPMVDGRYAKSPGRGIILASEKILGSTIVEFIDGVWGANFLDDTPIEDDFLTLIEILMAEWGNKDTKTQGLISQDYLP